LKFFTTMLTFGERVEAAGFGGGVTGVGVGVIGSTGTFGCSFCSSWITYQKTIIN
jgi:hypothetical protein